MSLHTAIPHETGMHSNSGPGHKSALETKSTDKNLSTCQPLDRQYTILEHKSKDVVEQSEIHLSASQTVDNQVNLVHGDCIVIKEALDPSSRSPPRLIKVMTEADHKVALLFFFFLLNLIISLSLFV